MLKILQARLQQYMNGKLPDVQAELRKGRGTRNQIANIHWVIENARGSQENIYFSFVIDISPGNSDYSLSFMQPGISHDVLCI